MKHLQKKAYVLVALDFTKHRRRNDDNTFIDEHLGASIIHDSEKVDIRYFLTLMMMMMQ